MITSMEKSNALLSKNSWRHWVAPGETLKTLTPRIEVITHCRIQDGQDREVTIMLKNGVDFTFKAHFTSGKEMYIPVKYRNDIRSSGVVDVSIIDNYAGKNKKSRTALSAKDKPKKEILKTRVFGDIPTFPPGSIFSSRKELSFAGIHPPLQAGISGSGKDGADSIVISGGYEDDHDYGDMIIYTGHGGQDIRCDLGLRASQRKSK